MNQQTIYPSAEERNPGTYNLTIYELKIHGKETPDRNDYIQAFEFIPDFVLKTKGILSSELNEGTFGVLLKSHRDAFKAINQWIIHFDKTANDSLTPDPPELHFSWEFDYKTHALQSWALLNLCEEILKRDLFGWKKEIPSLSSAQLWVSYECEQLEKTFKTTGILDTSSRKGKQSSCDAMLKQINTDFNSLLSRRFKSASKFQANQIQSWDSTEDAIRVHAEKIAQQDIQFSSIYSQYIKIRKQTLRSIRNNPNLQFAALETDGSLFVGGKGKRGKSQKGFCKEK
ncbi:hypothetical protein [Nostoc sp. FACHB-110]|uniref:hypothetical protein n=1 Tax=Nostoc sp. FACHB-110 TaxID=2692834 RepID=UPI00168904BB|nr:hypothetical protein [Nostoc sp. FACHB-110]MBD2438770.1 hypothetical protein [Nostoc sp. FACHB-110]